MCFFFLVILVSCWSLSMMHLLLLLSRLSCAECDVMRQFQMLMDPMGGIVMTNDGNAILREVTL